MEHDMNSSSLDGLSPAALSALAAIGALDEADRAAILKLHGVALGPRLWRPADGGRLPTLTALMAGRDRDRDAVYASRAWADAYRPTTWIVAYALQSPGLGRLSARLGGLALAKVGTARVGAVERRIADLGAERHGAWHRGERGYQVDDGFDRFTPAPRLQLAPQHVRSPVRLGLYGVEVGLPGELSPGRFEAEFNAALLPLRLQHVAGTTAGRDLCACADVDPAELRRFYRRGDRYRAATEIALLRPQADSGALGKLCADVVIDHVLGLLPCRSGR